MHDKEFTQMIQELVKKEEQRLQVGSASFIRRDKELMQMIEQAEEGVTNGKSKANRQQRQGAKGW